MRRIMAAMLITGALVAVPGVVMAKPFGYMGPGRAPQSNMDHAARKDRGVAVFRQTLTKPVVVAKSQGPVQPTRPATKPVRPASTVGFTVAP